MRIEEPGKYEALSLELRSVIFKMHGSLNLGDPERDSFVLTEDHYIEQIEPVLASLTSHQARILRRVESSSAARRPRTRSSG